MPRGGKTYTHAHPFCWGKYNKPKLFVEVLKPTDSSLNDDNFLGKF